jgi:hypothetical protein
VDPQASHRDREIRVDNHAAIAADRRTVRFVQPAAPDGRPRIAGQRCPNGRN